MATIPSTESILLAAHRSLGGDRYKGDKPAKFASLGLKWENHLKVAGEILDTIFQALDLEEQEVGDIQDNLLQLANCNGHVQCHTLTFDADDRQVLWLLLGHVYVPGLARFAANWSLCTAPDLGMPGGDFWYLPIRPTEGGPGPVRLPVQQVLDWLLDLLGRPLDKLVDDFTSVQETDGRPQEASIVRSLHTWRRDGTTPRPESIKKYFPDSLSLQFQSVFAPEADEAGARLDAAIDFVRRKGLTADLLRSQIPMSPPGLIEQILAQEATEEMNALFVQLLGKRYAQPSARWIRQYLLFARMVQDGYLRLVEQLCPGIDGLNVDPAQNKVLQLVDIFRFVYNLTIEANNRVGKDGEAAENAWFEMHLPPIGRVGLFRSILPSNQAYFDYRLPNLLTRYFSMTQPDAGLSDHVGYNDDGSIIFSPKSHDFLVQYETEIRHEEDLVSRMRSSSPWRALQKEDLFWAIWAAAFDSRIGLEARLLAARRLHEVAKTAPEATVAILIELTLLWELHSRKPKNNYRSQIEEQLNRAKKSEGFYIWEAAISRIEALHLLAGNDFKNAEKILRHALALAHERGIGSFRGVIARDLFGLEVANQVFNAGSHEKCWRNMVAFGAFAPGEELGLEDTARWVGELFWESIYKPYPDVEKTQSIAAQAFHKP